MADDKIKTREELSMLIGKFKKAGKKVVHTNGCYDLIHPGHISTLQKAKAQGDILVVSINSDASVKKFKGENRPVMNEQERAEVLAALDCVDYVTIFPEDDIINTLQMLKPDVHTKGGSFIEERVKAEKQLLESWGGCFVALPMVEGHSTTSIIERIIKSEKGRK